MQLPQAKRAWDMMKKICIFCEVWQSGGIESFLHNILSRADLSGIEVDIVTSELKESIFTEALQRIGVRFHELSGNYHRVLKNERLFRRLLAERGYDTVWLNVFQGMTMRFLPAAEALGVKNRIVHSHNSDLRESRLKRAKLLIHREYSRRYARFATELWACSRLAAEFMFPEAILREKGYRFIPNGIETARFRFDPQARERVREELGVSDRFVVGNVGRLCYQKNQSFLLDVFSELVKRKENGTLLLVGEGEDRAQLEEKAAALGIADSVIFYGLSSRVNELLCAMDAFVLPSRFEGLAISAVEAQASGLPVLYADKLAEETNVSGAAVPLSLELPPEAWADRLAEAETGERETACLRLREAGFDLAEVAERVVALLTDPKGQ